MRSRSFIELSSCAKICSRSCFCLSSPLTISSNEASGFAFSSCERMAPVCASIIIVASQQGQMIVNLEVSAMGLLLLAANSIATKSHKRHKSTKDTKENRPEIPFVPFLLFVPFVACYGITFFTALPTFLAPETVLSPTVLAPSTLLSPTFFAPSTVFSPTALLVETVLSFTSSALSPTSFAPFLLLSATNPAASATLSPVALSTFSVVSTTFSSPLREVTLTVRAPLRGVVTTTFETRGLSRKVLVSVRVPLASTLVAISELSGAGAVVGDVVAVAALALAFVVSFAVEHPIPRAAINGIVKKQIFFVTLLSS